MSARKDALRSYITLAFAEGAFANCKSPAQVMRKGVTLLSKDLASITGEILEMQARASGSAVTAAVVNKLSDLVGGIFERGPAAVWRDVREVYNRGMDANKQRGR